MNFISKKGISDNYTSYSYIDSESILHKVFFYKKDYRHKVSTVAYTAVPVTVITEKGYTVTKMIQGQGKTQFVEAMPRYNAKRLLEIVIEIDKGL